ncbi:T9SS type A sorting domain-containing protein [Balneolales bacterium ANBcel1]|nr:T9SS type A sorting domain-containing protein [Balneolales bacterium ANBcel1]
MASLMLDVNPDLKPEDIQKVLKLTAGDVAPGHDSALGAGYINAEAALDFVSTNDIHHYEVSTANNVEVIDVQPVFPNENTTVELKGYDQSSMPIHPQMQITSAQLKKAVLRVDFNEELISQPDVWLRYNGTSGAPISLERVSFSKYPVNNYDRYAKSVEITNVDNEGFDVEMYIWDYQQYDYVPKKLDQAGYYPNINQDGAITIAFSIVGSPLSHFHQDHTFTSSETINTSTYTGTTTINPSRTVTIQSGASVAMSDEIVMHEAFWSNTTVYGELRVDGTLTIDSGTNIEGGRIRVRDGGKVIILEGTTSDATRFLVDSGGEIEIRPGADLRFDPDQGFTIYGHAYFNGGSGFGYIYLQQTGSSGGWSGVQFQPGSSGYLNYCDIRHANNGVYANGASPEITNSKIKNNNTGVYFGYASMSIEYSKLNNNSTGIASIYSDIHLVGNEIFGNSLRGIQMVGATVNTMYFNVLANNPTGINALSPGVVSFSNNDFWTYHDPGFHISAANNAWVYGQNNWYGSSSPSASNFTTSSGGFISYNPASTSQNACHIWTPSNLQCDPVSPKVAGGYQTEAESEINEQDLYEVLVLLAEKETEEALVHLERLYKEAESFKLRSTILHVMAKAWQQQGRVQDFSNYMDRQIRSSLSNTDRLYAVIMDLESQFLIRGGNYKQAVKNYEYINEFFSEDSMLHQNALFGLGYIHFNRLGSVHQGARYFGELMVRYPDFELAKHIDHMYGKQIAEGVERARKKLAEETPDKLTLHRNYPNPYNPVTTIQFELPEQVDVRLTVYDILGRRVAVLVSDKMTAGTHTVQFDASNLASGVYIYRMTTPEFSKTRRMTVIK